MRREIITGLAVAGGLVAIVFGASMAKAADKGGPVDLLPPMPAVASSTSCYVQALAGSAVSTVGSNVLPDSLSASGWTIGGGVGCDVKLQRVVIGALARIELPIDPDGTFVDMDKSWMVAGKLGYMVNTGLMVYGLVGYESSELSLANIDIAKDGLVIGGGLEVMINKHLSLNAEYTHTIVDDTVIGGFAVKPESHKARLGLTYRFNSLFGD
jgi:opacity protein-like surface antigen